MAVQMQRVHAELKASVWGTWRQHLTEPTAPVPAPSVTRLLEMWDYEASLTIQVAVLTYRGGYHDNGFVEYMTVTERTTMTVAIDSSN